MTFKKSKLQLSDDEVFLQQLNKLLEEHSVGRNTLEQARKQISNKALLNYRNSEDYSPNDYISFETGKDAYMEVLVNKDTTMGEVYEKISERHSIPLEDLLEMKGNTHFYAAKVVMHFDKSTPHHTDTKEEHLKAYSEQKKIKDSGYFKRGELKKAHSLNAQLNKLSNAKKLSDNFYTLKDKVDNLEIQGEYLEGKSTIQDKEIASLKEITGVKDLPEKYKAKILRGKGISQKIVAEILGVTERTIRNWEKKEF